jgi:hypothetical protein
VVLALLVPAAASAEDPDGEDVQEPPAAILPPLEVPGRPYRTPRSGEGFTADLFGETIEVPPRDRRFVYAWDLGLAATAPGADEAEVLPFASLYFWHHPDEDRLLRAIVAGLFNEVFFAASPGGWGPFEVVLGFENLNVPLTQGELADGTRFDAEELETGYVRPGVGLGWRRLLDTGRQDNMLEVSLSAEPGYVYFEEGSDAAAAFSVPQDTFDLRAHLRVRLDALERNLLELAHSGFALGADGVWGYRTNWEDWGTNRSEDAGAGRDYAFLTAYALVALPLPFAASERHRLFASLHGGIGTATDRFSAPRVGGGPDPMGEEYGSTGRPIIPGAVIDEFFPERFVTAVVEYRWEAFFFAYAGPRASVSFLDVDRRRSRGIDRQDEVFASLGFRLTTGFVFETRLQLDYNHNFGVVRRGEYGGHEVVVHVSREF